MTATFTSEFREEFELERERWLRKRFLWYAAVILVLGLLTLAGALIPALGYGIDLGSDLEDITPEQRERARFLVVTASRIVFVLSLPGFLGYLWAFLHVRRHLLGRAQLLRLVFWLILANGVLALLGSVVQTEMLGHVSKTLGGHIMQGNFAALSVLSGIFFTHFFACCFLPWTPRESIRPIAPLLILNAVIALIYSENLILYLFILLFSPLVAAPGATICWWRHSRFHNRFQMGALKRRYGEMKQELTDARRIHEALFPEPVVDGPVRMDYRYQPMRQIGGDYLYSRYFPSTRGPLPSLSVVIIDVTGHGIPAALTVNRLHGELDRLYAERPDAGPGEILTSLNRYVHLTLASHSVYVTAICLRVDPNARAASAGPNTHAGVLEWASGGHPPAFVRSISGSIDRLDSTTFVLGATHGDDFQHCQQSLPFGPGDVLIAYTDGATEARDKGGRMLRIDGLQRVIASIDAASSNGSIAEIVLRAIDEFRFGPPADDTLVVEISRPLSA